jgi:hypothetical protein
VRPDTVELHGYPVQLGNEVAEHIEEWMREFRLIALSREAGTARLDVPDRLLQMVDALSRQYASELDEPEKRRLAAAARGERTVDLVYPVRPETEQVVTAWRDMLAEVDEYCRQEDLLTLQRPPEQIALQDWILDEFLRQLAGEPPRPWQGAHPAGG